MKAISRPKTLKEIALEELRKSIMSGKLKPGQRLVERSIGEQLQVSRTVVRECLRHLESEKLVSITPNTGPSVAKLSESDIREIYRLRALLESEGVSQCAQRISAPGIFVLTKLADKVSESLEQDRIAEALDYTTELYSTVFEIGNLPISWSIIEQLNSRINLLRMRSLSTASRLEKGPSNLKRLVELIAQGDAEKAADFCQKNSMEAMEAAIQQSSFLLD